MILKMIFTDVGIFFIIYLFVYEQTRSP